eukprot:12082655-Ditylum_brightwellii.AAC.1
MVRLQGLLTSSFLISCGAINILPAVSTLNASDHFEGFDGLEGLEEYSNLLVAHLDCMPLLHYIMLHKMMQNLGKVKTNEVGLSLKIVPNE